MDVCVRLFYVCVVLCVGSGLAMGRSPVQGVLPIMYRIRNLKNDQVPTKGCTAIGRGRGCSSTIAELGSRWRRIVNFTLPPFTPGEKASGTHWREAGLASEPLWTLWNREKSLASPWNRTPVVQPVVRRYNDLAQVFRALCISHYFTFPAILLITADYKATRFALCNVLYLRKWQRRWKDETGRTRNTWANIIVTQVL
jgi:hypothetical protein